jgi:hypothetical protein
MIESQNAGPTNAAPLASRISRLDDRYCIRASLAFEPLLVCPRTVALLAACAKGRSDNGLTAAERLGL